MIDGKESSTRYIKPGECDLLASTHLPCNECLRMIAAYGIKKVIYNHVYERDSSSIDLATQFDIKLENKNI